jgi:LmbE family N-acetylglucosaminyl deacetylase
MEAHPIHIQKGNRCAVIVAHPDDETLWAGGLILMHPEADWTVVTLCRKSDTERAEKFYQAMELYNAASVMGDLDDGPEQRPLPCIDVERTIMTLLPTDHFDFIVTHALWGEYTKHLRHEEVAHAVQVLHQEKRFYAKHVLHFAYDDHNGQSLPQADKEANILISLPETTWKQKYQIITEIYGFGPDSWEARTTPKQEAFWSFNHYSF